MLRAKTTASFIRTGALDAPNAVAARRALLLCEWGQAGTFNVAIRHIQGMGFSRMMAIAIAVEFKAQCKDRKFGGAS